MKRGEHQKIFALVVEDETKIGAYIKNKIEGLDPEFSIVAVAENGREALKLADKHHPQVVFTDISMPVMDGLELSRILKNTYPGIVVVIISGYSDFSYAQKAMRYGVFDYILKPLEDEKMSDLLFDVKRSLTYTKVRQERQILYSDVNLLWKSERSLYAVFSVCVGNLIYDVQDGVITAYYREEMEKIPWRTVMEQTCGYEYGWYLADEQAVNQKIVGIRMEQKDGAKIGELAESLLGQLKQHTRLAVHIGYATRPTTYEKVWNVTKYLRYLLTQELIVGRSQLLISEKGKEERQDLQEIVKMKLGSYIKKYFLSANDQDFTEEIQQILTYMIQNQATQSNIEKVSLYVLKLLEFSGKGYENDFLEQMQVKMQRCIGLSVTEQELVARMMESFGEIGGYMEQVYEKSIETRVMEYVDNNFLTLESLEQVADVFGYNYAYLSRMFKKMAGMPMNKYITEKKIELSKNIMREQPEMMLEEVCQLCGYNDYRYFSRVFKTQTGITPSEYRAKQKV